MHLIQDYFYDEFIRNIIDCSDKYNDKFIYNGKSIDGTTVRKYVADIEEDGFCILAKEIYDKCEVVQAKTQKEALEQVLAKNNIKYNGLLKLTTAENKKLLDDCIEPYTWIDFIVSNLDAEFSLTGTGNWHIFE